MIETIGLRSVRIRSLDRTIVTIPNAEFAAMHIENYSRRDSVPINTQVELRYETTPDQMRWVLTEIRKLLLQHPLVDEDSARARFAGFGSHSLNIELFAYVRTTDWNNYLGVQEDIFLRLIDIVDESGTGFAFPSTVNYFARDGGIDEERRQRVEGIIEELRKNNQLPFPDVDRDTRGAMADGLDYPPAGSATRR